MCSLSLASSQRPTHLNCFTIPSPALPLSTHTKSRGHSASKLWTRPSWLLLGGTCRFGTHNFCLCHRGAAASPNGFLSLFNSCRLISFPEKQYNMLLYVIHSILSRFSNILYTATVFSVTAKPQEKISNSSRILSSLFSSF